MFGYFPGLELPDQNGRRCEAAGKYSGIILIKVMVEQVQSIDHE